MTVTKLLADRNGRLSVKKTKRDRSRRSVTLAFCLGALAWHRGRMRAEGLDVDAGPIFADTRGGYMSKKNMRRRHYQKTQKQAGVLAVRFHDLRHCHATLLLTQGVHPKVVSERLGHASVGITLDTYSHVLPTLQQEAAEAFDQLFPACAEAADEANSSGL